jgi:hypothetical protein
VSVLINNKELLIDSINSSEEVNEFLKNKNISSSDFNLMHYSEDITKRRIYSNATQGDKPEKYTNFFNNYWLYSYEATPYSKLLSKLGFDARVFNFRRPSSWLSIMAEKPNMVMLLFSFFISIFITYLLHKMGVIRLIFRINTA